MPFVVHSILLDGAMDPEFAECVQRLCEYGKEAALRLDHLIILESTHCVTSA